MKIRQLMTTPVIRIGDQETVESAARTLARYNIGALPVCGRDGKVCGVVTDRDLVTRCIAAGRNPGATPVREVMTGGVVGISPDTEIHQAAALMGQQQIRRLPVLENGKLCGMISLADLSKFQDAAGALESISANISSR